MKCELARERMVTAAYDELAGEQTRELERHIAECPECGREREQLLELKLLAGACPVVEPDANLVARCRQKLDATLDALPPRRWYERLAQRFMKSFASLEAAPVAACLLLALGAGAGWLGNYTLVRPHAPVAAAAIQIEQKAKALVSPEVAEAGEPAAAHHLLQERHNPLSKRLSSVGPAKGLMKAQEQAGCPCFVLASEDRRWHTQEDVVAQERPHQGIHRIASGRPVPLPITQSHAEHRLSKEISVFTTLRCQRCQCGT